MKRALLAASLALVSCNTLSALSRGDVGGAVNSGVNDGVRLAQKAAAVKEACDPIAKAHVSLEEEYAFGGAVLVNLASQSKGVLIELSPELTGKVDAATWKGRKPAPGKGPKTDAHVYLDTLGRALAGFSKRPALDWTFVVIDADEVNAFSAPGGYVGITTGALKAVTNEAQLAGVLAHEIGHVAEQHTVTKYVKTKYDACLSVKGAEQGLSEADLPGLFPVPAAVSGGLASLFSAAVFNLDNADGPVIAFITDKAIEATQSLDKKDELEADTAAAEMLLLAGYDVGEYKKFIATLPDSKSLFDNHPPNAERVAAIDQAVKANDFVTAPGKAPKLPASLKAAFP
jgi:hypothetical protein